MGADVAMSVQQFAEMPPDERVRHELVEGELVPLSTSNPQNALASALLIEIAGSHVRRSGQGVMIPEVDCRTVDDTVRRPDVSLYRKERWLQFDRRKVPLPASPDIAIEILSPSEAMPTVRRKVREYLATGSAEVWTIDLDNQEIFIWMADDQKRLGPDDVLETPVIRGLRIPVADILKSE